MEIVPFFAFLVTVPPATSAWPAEFEATETARIYAHLQAVEARLRKVPSNASTRMQTLENLRRYRKSLAFPRNDFVDRTTPVFVDRSGTHCAVAYLLSEAGYGSLVHEVRTDGNLAYVPELARSKGADLHSAFRAIGLTAAEAAEIQPNYGYCRSRGTELCAESLESLVEADFVRLEDNEALFKVVRSLGGAPLEPGSELEVSTRFSRSGDFFGRFLIAVPSSGRNRAHRIEGAEVVLVSDPCRRGLRAPRSLVEDALRSPECVDRMEVYDPAWAGGWCAYDGELTCPDETEETRLNEPAPEATADPWSPSQNSESPALDSPESCNSGGSRLASITCLLGLLACLAFRRRATQ